MHTNLNKILTYLSTYRYVGEVAKKVEKADAKTMPKKVNFDDDDLARIRPGLELLPRK